MAPITDRKFMQFYIDGSDQFLLVPFLNNCSIQRELGHR